MFTEATLSEIDELKAIIQKQGEEILQLKGRDMPNPSGQTQMPVLQMHI